MEGQCLICGESHRDSPQIKHCLSTKNIHFSIVEMPATPRQDPCAGQQKAGPVLDMSGQPEETLAKRFIVQSSVLIGLVLGPTLILAIYYYHDQASPVILGILAAILVVMVCSAVIWSCTSNKGAKKK